MNYNLSTSAQPKKIVLASVQNSTRHEITFRDSPIYLTEINSQNLCFKSFSKKYLVQVHKDSSEVYICQDRFEMYNDSTYITAGGAHKYTIQDMGINEKFSKELSDHHYSNLCKIWAVRKKLTDYENDKILWEIVSLDENLIRKNIRTSQVDNQEYCLPLELNENMIIRIENEDFQITLL